MPKFSRRRLLRGSLGSLFGLSAIGVYGWQIEPHALRIARRELRVPGLGQDLKGRTLLQISDIHCGYATRLSHLQNALKIADGLQADFITYTGDYITEAGRGDDAAFADLVDAFPLGRLGSFGVLGNHDYGRRWREPAVAENLCTRLEQRGISMLRNDVATASGLQFIGMDDLWARVCDPARAFANANPALPSIALLHNPDGADQAGWPAWFKGFILSGHTHGGQVRLMGWSPIVPSQFGNRFAYGHVVEDGRHLIVSGGLGCSVVPVRLGVPPEITVVDLTG